MLRAQTPGSLWHPAAFPEPGQGAPGEAGDKENLLAGAVDRVPSKLPLSARGRSVGLAKLAPPSGDSAVPVKTTGIPRSTADTGPGSLHVKAAPTVRRLLDRDAPSGSGKSCAPTGKVVPGSSASASLGKQASTPGRLGSATFLQDKTNTTRKVPLKSALGHVQATAPAAGTPRARGTPSLAGKKTPGTGLAPLKKSVLVFSDALPAQPLPLSSSPAHTTHSKDPPPASTRPRLGASRGPADPAPTAAAAVSASPVPDPDSGSESDIEYCPPSIPYHREFEPPAMLNIAALAAAPGRRVSRAHPAFVAYVKAARASVEADLAAELSPARLYAVPLPKSDDNWDMPLLSKDLESFLDEPVPPFYFD